MERRGIGLEVLGVPNIIPEDRTVDKLLIHFLRPSNGGGEVQRVLYPCHRTGQALVIFEEPEVAARVLQRRPHVLEMNGERFPLDVRAADRPEVDLPVEATVDLSVFPDKAAVVHCLTMEGFKLTNLDWDHVRVEGSFMALAAVKADLGKLLDSPNQPRNKVPSPSPVLNGHTGAVSKHRKNPSRAQHAVSRDSFTSPDRRLPSSPPASYPASPVSFSSGASGSPHGRPSPPEYHSQWPARSPAHPSQESFVVDADLLRYAVNLKKPDMCVILDRNNIDMRAAPASPGLSEVTLTGRGANLAVAKLQSLLDDLTRTLRTQKIFLSDLDHDAKVSLARRIQEYKDIYPSVIITQVDDAIHMLGPSDTSFEVKQRLLGNNVAQPAASQRGRVADRGPRHRSSSMPRIGSKESRDEPRGGAYPTTAPPAGAHGYSSLKYSTGEPEGEAVRYSQMSPVNGLSEEEAGEKVKKSKRSHLGPIFKTVMNIKSSEIKDILKKNNKK